MPPQPLPAIDSLPAEQVASLASQLFIQARNLEQQKVQALHEARADRTTQEQNLKTAKQDTSLAGDLLDSLLVHLKAARTTERTATADWKKAQKVADYCEKIAVMDARAQRNNLPKAWQQVSDLLAPAADSVPLKTAKPSRVRIGKPKKDPATTAEEPPALPPASPDTAEQTSGRTSRIRVKKTAPPPGPRMATYDPAQDVMLHPPTPPCILVVDTRDEFTGATVRQTQAADLLRFTTPALRTYLEGKDQIICQAAISAVGTKYSLSLTFSINDPNGRRAFGSLPKNGLAILTFMDGTFFQLTNVRNDEGLTDPDTRTVLYRGQYPLEDDVLRKLRNIELDRLRIHWSTGYEDYDIQQVDVLMHQTKCIGG